MTEPLPKEPTSVFYVPERVVYGARGEYATQYRPARAEDITDAMVLAVVRRLQPVRFHTHTGAAWAHAVREALVGAVFHG